MIVCFEMKIVVEEHYGSCLLLVILVFVLIGMIVYVCPCLEYYACVAALYDNFETKSWPLPIWGKNHHANCAASARGGSLGKICTQRLFFE